MLKRIVIVAAGGTGSRLNANLPKQYMLLQGKPVLHHTLALFDKIADKIIIAIHPDMQDYWKELCKAYPEVAPHEVIFGGKTRFQSVKNALKYIFETYQSQISASTSIAVHDAARPLTDPQLIKASFDLAAQGQSNALAVASTNSIRIGTLAKSTAIDRNTVWQIQTPQTFPAMTLYEAYQQEESDLFTDDTSVVEKMNVEVNLLESTAKNLKLTYAEDFEIANIYMHK